MAGAIKKVKRVDNHYRVALPREWANVGDDIYFEITKSGNLVLHKVKKQEEEENTPRDDNEEDEEVSWDEMMKRISGGEE